MTTVACIQLTSSDDIAANCAMIEPLVYVAVQKGATFIALPENAYFMRREAREKGDHVATARYTMVEHAGLKHAQTLAAEHGVWLLVGSIAVVEEGDARSFNRSVLVDDKGEIAAVYDKIHLFDVSLPNGQTYKESERIRAGSSMVQTQTPFFNLGMSVCYDVRFPQLYRTLAKAGAEVLAVPSAFTVPTGLAHWEVLLRARAIENGAYVIAPAQTGMHAGGRETYGHSMIIDPWGRVLADAGTEMGVITAEIDIAEVARIRASLPSLQHDKL
jgi:deaminated glutathione amidase